MAERCSACKTRQNIQYIGVYGVYCSECHDKMLAKCHECEIVISKHEKVQNGGYCDNCAIKMTFGNLER